MAVYVIGGGFAGCEAVFQLGIRGIDVKLVDMKPERMSPAHHSELLCELVCSNSFKAADVNSASGLLKEEMRRLGSLVLRAADVNKVPAGGALAVDRDRFSAAVTETLAAMPNVVIIGKTVLSVAEAAAYPDCEALIIATGPLTDEPLAESIKCALGEESLSFFDAAAPLVFKDSIDFDHAFYASRYDKGESDYINCPLSEPEYREFYRELTSAQCAEVKDFDAACVYEGCMPVEVMAGRGYDTLRYGPMKPVGIRNPETGEKYYAVVQLRRDDSADTLYNIVGFQTRLKFGEQKRVFGLIPALRNAEYARYGVMHKNTYIKSPGLLDDTYRVLDPAVFGTSIPVFFAGQITGVEGYIESASSGLVAGINACCAVKNMQPFSLPQSTQIGALCAYASGYQGPDFQPMGANFGIMRYTLPAGTPRRVDKKRKKELISQNALDILNTIITDRSDLF
ncbi:MAG: methylenetetrahydrofolate--tRNA-(uracil(54)-C(5))-methyltransferase (FADH(2)-oxidizing) TrmFO [Clostridia bacterium]|nr:methylenetetrahydrofolate--tRNA-(uracil(54)-C(5))-methyltransferase (FADH(2)-oxidizing) TrmFO [Clostridia bacterium]